MIHSVFDRLLRISFGIALVALLGSCGLKGDLYLPEPEKAVEQVSPESTSADQPDASVTATSATSGTADDQEEKARAKQPADPSNQP